MTQQVKEAEHLTLAYAAMSECVLRRPTTHSTAVIQLLSIASHVIRGCAACMSIADY